MHNYKRNVHNLPLWVRNRLPAFVWVLTEYLKDSLNLTTIMAIADRTKKYIFHLKYVTALSKSRENTKYRRINKYNHSSIILISLRPYLFHVREQKCSIYNMPPPFLLFLLCICFKRLNKKKKEYYPST